MELMPGYKQTEVGAIPVEWEVATFDEVFNVIAGGDVDPKRSKSYRDDTHRYPIYSNALTNHGLYGYCSYTDHQANSITITARGTLGFASFRDHAYTAIGRVLVLHPKQEVAGSFFAEVINNRVKFAIESTGVPQLTAPQLSTYKLPVPPLTEQRAIARTLGDVDALLDALTQLIAKKRELKQAAMQELLTGKQRLPGFSGEWEVRQLGEIGSFSKGQGIRKNEVVTEGIPCVRYGEIYTHHTDYVRAFFSFIPAQVAKNSQRLQQGDLLFAGSGETAEEIGKCVAFLNDIEAYAGGDIVIFRPVGQDSMYLGYLMNYASIVEQKARMGQGDAVVHVSARNLAKLKVRLPQPDEQTAIAAVLSDMDAELAALEQRLVKTRTLKQGMMQELLTGKTRLL